MQTKPKANSIITHALLANGLLQFTVLGCEPFTIDPEALPDHKAKRARIHGIVQRISDGGALSRNKDTGKPASPADKRARMLAIRDHLLDPATPWEMKGGGGVAKPSEALLQAVAEARGEEVDEAFRARVAAQAEKRGMKVGAFLEAIRAQSATVREIEARIISAGLAPIDLDEDWDDEAPEALV